MISSTLQLFHLKFFSQSPLSSAVHFSLLDMDKNNKEEHSRGGPPVTFQHHTEDMALSLQDKNHSPGLVPRGEEESSRQGASSRHSAHGFFGMEIDESSRVFNGDARGKHPAGTQLHMISGGSVKKNSTLFNGDLDPESFKKFFGKER